MSSEEQVGGPYLLFVTAGYADGRAARPDPDDGYGETVTTGLSTGLSNALTETFTVPADSCANGDIKC
jgi:hypothetical protein